MKKRTVLLFLALVVVVSISVFTANAATENSLNSIDNSSISAKFAEGTTMAVCPKCGGDPVEWKPINGITTGADITAGHYYLTGNYKQYLSVSGAKEVCIHLNGYNWDQTAKSRALYMSGTAACTINIMGEGTVCGSDGYTDRTTRGATIEVNGSGAVLNLYGGTYTKHVTTSVGSGSMEISGPTVALYTGGGTINMYAGVMITGENTVGNTVRVPTGTFHMYGGTITGGTGAQGGNVLVTYNGTKAAGTFIMEDGLISNGTAAGYGGNIRVDGGGTAGDKSAPKAVFEMLGGTISGGSAKSNGGNVYATTNSVVTICGTVKDNVSAAVGGNISAAGQSQVTLRNATISGGVADSKGQNVHQAGGADFTIEGNTRIIDGNWWNTQAQCVVNVGEDFSGVAQLYFEDGHLVDPVYGTALKAVTCEGAFSGKLYLDGDYDCPEIYGMADGKLYVAVAQIVGNDSKWATSVADAVALAGENDSIKLYIPGEITVAEDKVCTIDLNGQNVSITGTGAVKCFDSANDNFVDYGSATIAATVTLLNQSEIRTNGKYYITLAEENVYTFHCLDMRVSGVSIRPSCAGVYYSCVWNCDDMLKPLVASFGVAVSVVDMPGEDFTVDGDTLYTQTDASQLVKGAVYTSALIENILEENAPNNAQRGKEEIYAAPYVILNNGKTTVASYEVKYSLYDAMRLVDQCAYLENYVALENFRTEWMTAMQDWEFDNIGIRPEKESEIFRVLMIGQSHAQDSVWLLQDVLKAEMPEQDVMVVDVYQPLQISAHISNIKSGAEVYDYCKIENGNVVTTPNYKIETALKNEMWDLIIFNEATWPQIDEAEHTDGDIQWLTDYIRETAAPGFKLAYNATWAQPVSKDLYGADRQSAPDTFRNRFETTFGGSRQKHFNQICKVITTYVETDPDYDFVFHSGTAIQYASETHGVPEVSADRNYDLYRDYTHLSDFGRLLVAYQLYAQIFGIEELTEVNVDVIEQHMRATYREKACGDLVITEDHKQAIIASVNYALKNPNVAPEQLARDEVFLEPLT